MIARLKLLVFLVVGLELSCQMQVSAQTPLAKVDFNRDIRPLLSDRCFACHGPDAEHREADLRLDQLESLQADRGGYQVVEAGKPAASELIRRVAASDPSERMPPPESGKPLVAAEIELLERWVAEGAQWQQHWAYVAPAFHPTPLVGLNAQSSDDNLSGHNWIDAFIAEELSHFGGSFSPPADEITLLRRLSFDLTGLPPLPETLRAVRSDSSPAAVDGFIESLLASPAFGERMAVYWLDLVRYADTVGYHGDQNHNISLYRDYVINAFNDNLPFDEFTREQLAGDLLPEPTDEQIIATGYNRVLQTSHEGGVQPKEYLAIYAADRVRNISAVWMGATVGCAQCHDHKFDPYTAHDFYALAAFFADVDETQHLYRGSDTLPTERRPEKNFLDRVQRLEVAALERQLSQLAGQANANDRRASLQQQIDSIQAAARMTMITESVEPRLIRYLPRGNWLDDSGEVMQPRVPEFMGSLATNGERASRLDLANWLVDTEQGAGLLTARVFVNRLWMLMFGQGLSRSVDDFGGQGEPPSHPRLLDRLAIEFVNSGWDVKHMVRLITASRAYRQSSLESNWQRSHDPLNRLLSRQHRFRLPAEMIRDTALACGNLLVSEIGGPSVRPYQPAGYYRHLNFPTRVYQPSTDDGQWRRGLYMHWQRQFLHPMLRAFDAPTREECTAQRPQSNTPLAALVWLNDPSFIEAARGLAVRVLTELPHQATAGRLERMFEIATSRSPDEVELKMLSELWHRAQNDFSKDARASRELLAVGDFQAPPHTSPESLAAWTTVARAVMNLNETFTRN